MHRILALSLLVTAAAGTSPATAGGIQGFGRHPLGFGMQPPPGPSFSQLYMFQGQPDGQGPQNGVTDDKSGDLFGTTDIGGASNNGAVYEMTKAGQAWTERVVFSFSGTDGGSPEGTPTVDKAGNIYVTSIVGGDNLNGSIVKLSPSNGGYTETANYLFKGPEGDSPAAGLLERGANFYTVAAAGGAFGAGSIVEVTPSLQVTDVYDFRGAPYDGAEPQSNLIADPSGALYGTTVDGGSYNLGTVFKFVPAKHGQGTVTILHSFTGGADGAMPLGSAVVRNAQGDLFGVTVAGGDANGDGVIFELTPGPSGGGYEETILHRFTEYPDGFNPVEGLTFKGRYIYGTAANGGVGGGTIFRLLSNGSGYTTVYNFGQNSSPAFPRCQLLSRGSSLYGTTGSNVGSVAWGTVFEYTP